MSIVVPVPLGLAVLAWLLLVAGAVVVTEMMLPSGPRTVVTVEPSASWVTVVVSPLLLLPKAVELAAAEAEAEADAWVAESAGMAETLIFDPFLELEKDVEAQRPRPRGAGHGVLKGA
jgi:hypothetical protein